MESLFPGLEAAPNLHPMVVHFPIAFWMAGLVAWGVALARANDDAWRFGLWLQTAGLLGAAVAVVAGFIASEGLGHDSSGHDLVHVHRDFMLVSTGLSTLVVAVGWWKRAGGTPWRLALVTASVALALVTTLGADRGAALVYGEGVGVRATTPDSAASAEHGAAHDEHEHTHE